MLIFVKKEENTFYKTMGCIAGQNFTKHHEMIIYSQFVYYFLSIYVKKCSLHPILNEIIRKI